MSYTSISKCADDGHFNARITACCAQEGITNPQQEASEIRWAVAAKSDIEAAYAYALNAGNPSPGADPTVITDGQILSAVQSIYDPAGTPS